MALALLREFKIYKVMSSHKGGHRLFKRDYIIFSPQRDLLYDNTTDIIRLKCYFIIGRNGTFFTNDNVRLNEGACIVKPSFEDIMEVGNYLRNHLLFKVNLKKMELELK